MALHVPSWILGEQSQRLLLIASQELHDEVRIASKKTLHDIIVLLEELNGKFFPLG